MSYLTPILCTGNRTTHSETSTKTQCILCWRHECFANSRWDLKSAKLKCSQRHYFSSTAKLKCRKIKFLDQNTKLKCCGQTFKNLSVKKGKKSYKNAFVLVYFSQTYQTKNVFSEAKFLFSGWREQTNLKTSNNPDEGATKKLFWSEEKHS